MPVSNGYGCIGAGISTFTTGRDSVMARQDMINWLPVVGIVPFCLRYSIHQAANMKNIAKLLFCC